jgi:hypothetical protein
MHKIFISRSCYNRAVEAGAIPGCWLRCKRRWSLEGVTVTTSDEAEMVLIERMYMKYA